MRFALVNDELVPEPLAEQQSTLRPISQIPHWNTPAYNPHFSYSPELQHILAGKQLLLEELSFSTNLLHEHYQNGCIFYRKGIENDRCERCGNSSSFGQFPCARCKQDCRYCRRCLMMGRVSECTPLVSWSGPIPAAQTPPVMTWSGTLSPPQQDASQRVIESMTKREELLVWAVCGAGKTEVLFPGIEAALKQNLRVCLASPRTDVIIELKPRLQAAFSQTDVIALYGGSPDRSKTAPLVLSTTHQLLRYYKNFDLIILDEVDAFPYTTEPMLHYAVKQARKDDSALVYLTATPSLLWQKEVERGKRNAVMIPARYHRHAIPVPTFQWCDNWRKALKKKRLVSVLVKWLQQRVNEQKQVFLFLPQISLMETVVTCIKTFCSSVEGVHSEDPNRKEKVARFRKGEILILVTTTILERGVTVPNIDVAVLGAEDGIFTESALVQIGGRVGRSASFPRGTITFFHYGKTLEMKRAVHHIKAMNKLAKGRGLIDD